MSERVYRQCKLSHSSFKTCICFYHYVFTSHRLLVCRYIYFPCSRRQFGLEGPSLLELDIDEIPEEGTLASSLAVSLRLKISRFLCDQVGNSWKGRMGLGRVLCIAKEMK